jgi:hypothetical protein
MWSNVGRIAECISDGKRIKQIVGYISGIGTEGGRFRKIKDQATGYGNYYEIITERLHQVGNALTMNNSQVLTKRSSQLMASSASTTTKEILSYS